ncbi:MAG: DNA repair protein RadA, partial [Geodermatophilaceae bacterium]
AMASARLDKALPGRVIAIGEVGLSGELRRVRGLPRRIAEAIRLGYSTIIVAPDSPRSAGPDQRSGGVDVHEAPTLGAALAALLG